MKKKILILLLLVIIGTASIIGNNVIKEKNKELKDKNEDKINKVDITNDLNLQIFEYNIIDNNTNTYVDLNLKTGKIKLYEYNDNQNLDDKVNEENNIQQNESEYKKIKNVELNIKQVKLIDNLISNIINDYDKYNNLGKIIYSSINENVWNENKRMAENYKINNKNYYTTNYYKVFKTLDKDESGILPLEELGTIYLEDDLKIISVLFK